MSARDLTLDLLIRYGFQAFGAVLILAAGLVVARWIGAATDRRLERRAMEPPMRRLAVRAIQIVIVLFTLVAALDKFGFQIAPLVAGIGVAGLGIGIALQGVLGNLVAGLSIIFTKPFRVGEYIELLGVHGEVTSVELSSTVLVHPDRSRVVIPNRKIVGEILHNFGVMRQLSLHVTVAYGTDLAEAQRLAQDVLRQNPRVLAQPTPVVGLARLGESGVEMLAQPWVRVPDYVPAQAELYQALVERLRVSGIAIPFPQQEVRLLTAA